MTNALKKLIINELTICKDNSLLDLIYKLLLTVKEEEGIRWADVLGYEDLYEVSTKGEIRNKKNNKILKSSTHQKGYRIVTLKGETKTVHRIVATAFIPNPDKKPQVNHINGDKTDNRSANLEWVTGSENVKHAYTIGTKVPKGATAPEYHGQRHHKAVICVETKVRYNSIQEAAKATGACAGYIPKVCDNPERTAGGYHWRKEVKGC